MILDGEAGLIPNQSKTLQNFAVMDSSLNPSKSLTAKSFEGPESVGD